MEIPPHPTVFKLIRWGVLIMLCFGVAKSIIAPRKPLYPPHATSSGSEESCNCAESNPFNNFSALAFPIVPVMAPNLQVVDTKPGTGEMAVCGLDAVVHYSLTTQNKAEIYNDLQAKDKPRAFRIGSGDMLPGIERGIIGMKVGGTRTIAIPATLAFGGVKDVHTLRDNDKYKFEPPSDPVVATVSLVSVSPPLPAPPSDVMLRFLGGPMGNGVTAQCGNTVYAALTVWKLDGTKLFSTSPDKPLVVTLGAGYAPSGLEFGMLGMREGAVRTLIIPPAYAHSLFPQRRASEKQTDDLLAAFPADETVLLEVMLLPSPKPVR